MYGDIGIGKCVNIYKNIKKYVTFFKYVSLNNVAKIYRKSIFFQNTKHIYIIHI